MNPAQTLKVDAAYNLAAFGTGANIEGNIAENIEGGGRIEETSIDAAYNAAAAAAGAVSAGAGAGAGATYSKTDEELYKTDPDATDTDDANTDATNANGGGDGTDDTAANLATPTTPPTIAELVSVRLSTIRFTGCAYPNPNPNPHPNPADGMQGLRLGAAVAESMAGWRDSYEGNLSDSKQP
jgi:hypothetical protein